MSVRIHTSSFNRYIVKISCSIALVATTLFYTLPAIAQGTDPVPFATGTQGENTDSPFVSCFDYYAFGSVSAEPQLSLTTLAAGAPLAYSLTVTNSNQHPIIDTQVFVKIMRTVSSEKSNDGSDVVAQFIAVDNVDLKGGETKTFDLTWQSPSTLVEGEYAIAPYVLTHDRFSFQGLTFTNDVTGPKATFAVVSEIQDAIRFDTSRLTFDGEPYNVIGISPEIYPQPRAVVFEAPVINETARPARGTVTWNLYHWDGTNSKNLITSNTEEVEIHPTSETLLSYTITNSRHPIYYLEGVMNAEGNTSIVSARFVVHEVESARFNDIGVDSYPLTNESTAYVCVHNLLKAFADPDTRGDARLALQVLDHNGMVLASKEYTGKIPYEIVALPLQFKNLIDELTSFTVKAELTLNGTVVDVLSAEYSCERLGATCPPSSRDQAASAKTLPTTVLYGGAAIILLLIGLWYSVRRFVYKDIASP